MTPYETRLWHKLIRRFSLLFAFKTMLVVILCYYAGMTLSLIFHFSLPTIAGLWCVISGIVVLQVLINESLKAGWLRILGSFLGALVSCLMAMWLGYNLITLAISVFLVICIASFFHIKETFRLAALTAAIIIIVGISQPQMPPFANAAFRFIESAIGAMIGILLTTVFYPLRKKLNLLH